MAYGTAGVSQFPPTKVVKNTIAIADTAAGAEAHTVELPHAGPIYLSASHAVLHRACCLLVVLPAYSSLHATVALILYLVQ